MKYIMGLSYFCTLASIFLVLCCISTAAYATDDEPMFWINPPWPQLEPWYKPLIIIVGCAPTDEEPIFRFEPWFEPIDFGPGYGGTINLEDIDIEALLMFLSYQPRFNGVPPIEVDGTLFDAYNLGDDSYGIMPSFDITSYPMGGAVITTPEPATVLLLGLGALIFRRRKRERF